MDDALAIILAGVMWALFLFTATGAYLLNLLLSVNSAGL